MKLKMHDGSEIEAGESMWSCGYLTHQSVIAAQQSRWDGHYPPEGGDASGCAPGWWEPSEREECPDCAHVMSPWACDRQKVKKHCMTTRHMVASMFCGDEWM